MIIFISFRYLCEMVCFSDENASACSVLKIVTVQEQAHSSMQWSLLTSSSSFHRNPNLLECNNWMTFYCIEWHQFTSITANLLTSLWTSYFQLNLKVVLIRFTNNLCTIIAVVFIATKWSVLYEGFDNHALWKMFREYCVWH